jgi:cytochrome c biogenesis protein CcmG/thiol:disulfide interchange protein DsbE
MGDSTSGAYLMTRTKQPKLLATFLFAILVVGSAVPTQAQDPPTDDQPTFKLSGPPWLGVRMTDEASRGVRIAGVAHGSPAQKAGLRAGDIVLRVGSTKAKSAEHLAIMVRGRRTGDTLPLTVLRDGSESTFDVKLEEMPSRTDVLASHLVGRDAPGFRANLIAPNGGETSLASFKGKPMVLEFWATWCGPCREMSSNLKRLKRKFGDDLHVVALSAEDATTVMKYVRRHGASYVVGRDLGRSAHDNYFVVSFPTVVLIDSDGQVAAIGLGNGEFPRFERQVASIVENYRTSK